MRVLLTRPAIDPDGDRHPAGSTIFLSPGDAAPLLESGAARSPSGDRAPLGVYDPATQLYNWRAENTRAWRRAVARGWSGGAGRINCYGPSTVAGYTTTGRSEWWAWPSFLRRLLARDYGEAGTGVIFFAEPDDRVKLWGSSWTQEQYGPYGRSCWASKDPSSVFTFTARATGWRVTYLQCPGAGRLSAVSDLPGQNPTVADCNGPFGVRTVALPAGPLGDHTLRIQPNTNGSTIFVLAVEGYVGPTSNWTPAGISVTNVGRGSTVVGNLVYGETWLDTSLKASVDAIPADMSIVAFAENSPGYQTPDQMKADYRPLLNRIRASGSDILLCTSIDWQGNISDFKAPQPAYDNAVYELADEYDVPVFDIAARWGRWEDSPGYYADRIHPSPAGYADIAAGVLRVLQTGI